MDEFQNGPQSDESEMDERPKARSLMDSLFDEDEDEDYSLPSDSDEGPSSLEEYFAQAALQEDDEEEDGDYTSPDGQKLFDEEKLDSELDKAFKSIVKTPSQVEDALQSDSSDEKKRDGGGEKDKSKLDWPELGDEDDPPKSSQKEKKGNLDWPELGDDEPPPTDRQKEKKSKVDWPELGDDDDRPAAKKPEKKSNVDWPEPGEDEPPAAKMKEKKNTIDWPELGGDEPPVKDSDRRSREESSNRDYRDEPGSFDERKRSKEASKDESSLTSSADRDVRHRDYDSPGRDDDGHRREDSRGDDAPRRDDGPSPDKHVTEGDRSLAAQRKPEPRNPAVPEWCRTLTFPELTDLNSELTALNEEVRRAQERIHHIEDQANRIGHLKDALLSLSGARLTQACSKVFEELSWSVTVSDDRAGEIWLKDGDTVNAIVRIVDSTGQPNRSELAKLAESIVRYWSMHDNEPKGVLLASTFMDRAPEERTEEDFPGQMREFASRKDLCMVTCMQLLSIYRDVALKNADKNDIRNQLLSTKGALPGHRLEAI